MRIVARRTLKDYVASRAGYGDTPALSRALDAWYHEVLHADWGSMADVKEYDGSASVISADRVVFNIKGNSYRLVVSLDFEKGGVWIRWIGTHEEYGKIDVRTVRYERA